ncbi:hypothetical protein KVR01_010504 [Diaporthe batatas]|uniref:uncharacterized protein n=1 Tax=Diaporthe batatas TaxID=748121 RepID=UPI001D041738|nr:uncharacterized protein KVR01_010504 [Diaporthe batatas]KAG8159867.1 hypothetical protein KVR01_010504 [Diaporthe batatas]
MLARFISPARLSQARKLTSLKMTNPVEISVYPHATGLAATSAAAHEAEHPLKLYGSWFCPFVQRAWVVLHEKKIPHQYVEINPYNKSPEFLALNPRGLVPTLGVPAGTSGKDPKPLYESLVLCEYLDEAYADEARFGPRLLPGDAYERARCRLWADHVATKVVPAYYKVLMHTPDKAHSIEDARAEFLGSIETLVGQMGGGGPWFLGDRFSLVDVMLAPWAVRLFLLDHYKPGGSGIDEARAKDQTTWARWQNWFDAITSRQSVRETSSDDEKYIDYYRSYTQGTTPSIVGQATRKG